MEEIYYIKDEDGTILAYCFGEELEWHWLVTEKR
jgi:hypothetical protein